MKITFLSPAERELDEAVDYYEAQKPGLGNEFLEKVRAAVELIECYPGAWQLINRNARQCRISRFPYNVIYQIRDGGCISFA